MRELSRERKRVGAQSLRPTPGAVSGWLLAVAIAGSALAVGTVHTLTLCIVCGLLAAAAAVAWWGAEPMHVRTPATVLLFTGVGLTAYTSLQCVPMPMAWLAVIAPHNAEVWSRALTPLHEAAPNWAPISLDPVATRVEVLKGVAYVLAFVTALRVARRRGGTAFLAAAIVITAIVLSVAAVLHPAFGIHKLYGVYEPGESVGERHVAPLMNPNHLAAYVNIALSLVIAGALATDATFPRPILLAIAIVLIAVQIWVASRAGVLLMAIEATLVVMLVRKSRSRSTTLGSSRMVIAGVMVAGAALIVLGGSLEVRGELFANDTSKLDLIRQSLKMLRPYGLLGAGRGAFESTFPEFRSSPGYLTFSHPENIVVQWSGEWGVVVGVVALLVIASAMTPRAAQARSTLTLGAWAAVAGTMLHNLCDFSSEVPGVMIAVVTCGGMIVAGTSGRSPERSWERWATRPRTISLLSAGAAIVALAWALPVVGGELVAERRRAFHLALDKQVSLASFDADMHRDMSSHPAEPYFPFIAAVRATKFRDDEPMRWLNATLERAQIYGPAQLILARLLVSRGLQAQARLEYRLTIEQDPDLNDVVAPEVLPLVHGFDDAMELSPPGARETRLLSAIATSCIGRLPATTARLDAEITSRVPLAHDPRVRAAAAAVQDLEDPDATPWCQGSLREPCRKEAARLIQAVEDESPRSCEGLLLRARALIAAGQVQAGLDYLERRSDESNERVACLVQLEVLSRRSFDEARAERALQKIVHAGCDERADCLNQLTFVAREQEARGYPALALAAYDRAYEQSPDDEILAQTARLAAETGLHARALSDYEKLARRHPEEPRWSAAVKQERDALGSRTVAP